MKSNQPNFEKNRQISSKNIIFEGKIWNQAQITFKMSINMTKKSTVHRSFAFEMGDDKNCSTSNEASFASHSKLQNMSSSVTAIGKAGIVKSGLQKAKG